MDERERVLEDNEIFCKLCLRIMKRGRGSNSCGPGRHTVNTGFNGMCSVKKCERHVTMCRRHEPDNRTRHKIFKRSLDWAQSFRPQQNGQQRDQTSLLMLMADESELRGEEELNEMNDACKEIHLKRGADTSNIFGYMNRNEPDEVTLAVVEDR